VWLKIAKKGRGIASVTNAEALDVGLCFGWINGRRDALDDDCYLQRYTPRRPRSKWSRINVEKVAELTAAGRIRPAGLAEVERAKADGRWDSAYESPSRIGVPDDLERAPGGAGVLRGPRQPQSLRDPVWARGREAARDTRATASEIRRRARGQRTKLVLRLTYASRRKPR
jgi:hypothetical protein